MRQKALQIHSFYDPARGKWKSRTRGRVKVGAGEQWVGVLSSATRIARYTASWTLHEVQGKGGQLVILAKIRAICTGPCPC